MNWKKVWRRVFPLMMCLSLLISGHTRAATLDTGMNATVQFMQKQYNQKGAVQVDDWSIVALASAREDLRSAKWGGATVWDAELQKRYKQLDQRKTTDYARFILAVIAAGQNPKNFHGTNLIETLKKAQLPNGKFADQINGQGQGLINAHIWSINALYAAGEPIPKATLAKAWLVAKQLPDGGYQYDVTSKRGGIDMTAMALLSFKALGMKKEEKSVTNAFGFMRKAQAPDAGFAEGGIGNAESIANVISAFVAWGEKQENWKKGSATPLSTLLLYQKTDGMFSHTKNGLGNKMATAQAFLALTDVKRGTSYLQFLRDGRTAVKR